MTHWNQAGRRSLVLLLAIGALGCGARTGTIDHEVGAVDGPVPQPEVCNGLDDDLDGLVRLGVIPSDGGFDAGVGVDASIDGGDMDLFVDEDFRDEIGRYVDDAHCGRCGAACIVSREHELEVGCGLVDEYPTCVATLCDPGFIPSTAGRCVPLYERLCLFCADDGDCGDFDGARCASIGDEQRCAIDCELGCPDGYACSEGICAPESGSCTCEAGDDFDLACALTDPDGNFCPGSATCADGVLSMCAAPFEDCDHEDDDCNGVIDDGFVDRLGAYSLDIHHCGDCGVDCTLSAVPEGDLVCGGDPFAPTCVLFCPDTADGIDIGDRVDGDRLISTGCECTVSSVGDEPGPVRVSGEMLDVNCDGADGIVVQSFYVAPDGNDSAVGSPTRPLRTLAVAVQRAHDSILSSTPRPHVFVASGTYTETLVLPDGVLIHGGYRRDYLALDPDGFRVDIRAPSDTTAPGGAAVVIREVGTTQTLLEWVFIRGRDATTDGAATFGIYAIDPGPNLTLRDLTVRAGGAGAGRSGTRGTAGVSFMSLPTMGATPRGAIENPSHLCLTGDGRNRVMGGSGGVNRCGSTDASGGAGGSSRCPIFAEFEPAGIRGLAAGSLAGGDGGAGGQDSNGPITRATGTCDRDVCCGLADFSVPTDFTGPQPGRPGLSGSNGRAGNACTEPFGRFMSDSWVGMDATSGSLGTPGSGGGGGGAGGGAEMDWFAVSCEFADGLGGGGGGGGAGGCGGTSGSGATSGAPSVAILIRYSRPGLATSGPTITRANIVSGEGGRGGDGGAGGEGGRGALGAFGGEIPRPERSTPTLAGPFAGGRGGAGGNGGAGGGGGGGCGGASVGIWVTGLSSEPPFTAAWRSGNTFSVGSPGPAGRGGGGPATGADGAEGGASDVLVR